MYAYDFMSSNEVKSKCWKLCNNVIFQCKMLDNLLFITTEDDVRSMFVLNVEGFMESDLAEPECVKVEKDILTGYGLDIKAGEEKNGWKFYYGDWKGNVSYFTMESGKSIIKQAHTSPNPNPKSWYVALTEQEGFYSATLNGEL